MPHAYRFSANTGFLYQQLPFLERIRAAARDGFDAVEFHDEAQECERGALLDALHASGLQVTGLNVRMGPSAGCAAIPGETAQARRDIDAAVELAEALDAGAIHVLAGKTDATRARAVFVDNLRYALSATSRTLLMEPLCSAKMPDYWLNSLDVALDIIEEIGDPRLRVMFDVFHIETEHGDTRARFERHAAHVGHVQLASVPARAEPESGPCARVLDTAVLLPAFRDAGYAGAFGCEYVPTPGLPEPLDWLQELKRRLPE